MGSRWIRDFFEEGPDDGCPPDPPRKRELFWPPRLSAFAAVARSSYEKAPPREQMYWNVIGATFLMVCMLSTAAATVAWALQSGHPVEQVLYVPLVWFPLIATFELLISVSIRPNTTKVVALLVAVRFLITGWVGYQISEPLVVWLNHKAIAVQVAKDIRNDGNAQSRQITASDNRTIAGLQNGRGKIIRKENGERDAVRFWEFRVRPCAPGATDCIQGHAARLKQAKDTLARQLENDKGTLASLNVRIAAWQHKRDVDIAHAQKTVAASDDLALRERALGELMNKQLWLWLFVWGLRVVFWGVDISCVLAKMAIVRKGTVADKADEADERERELEQKRRLAIADAMRIQLEAEMDLFPELAREVARKRGDVYVEAATRHLTAVPDVEPSVPEPPVQAGTETAAKRPESDLERELRRRLEEEKRLRAQAQKQAVAAVEMIRHGTAPENRYQMREPLGLGGSGHVWLARDAKNKGELVAVKVLRGDREIGETERRLMREELATLKKLHHSHIVKLLDAYTYPDGRPAIVLEYVRGRSLYEAFADRAARGERFTVEEMLTVIVPICDALDYLHGKGYLHQDVKPANILGWGSGDPGDIRLTDFHIAAMIGLVPSRPAGTDGYCSPEQLSRDPLDARSDLYAIGVIMFELVSGTRLFKADAEQAFTRESPPTQADILAFTENIPLSKVIAACLSFDPAGRPASAQQLIDELRKAVGLASTPIIDGPDPAPLAADDFTLPYDELEPRRPDVDETPGYAEEDDPPNEGRN